MPFFGISTHGLVQTVLIQRLQFALQKEIVSLSEMVKMS